MDNVLRRKFSVTAIGNSMIVTVGDDDLITCAKCGRPLIPKRDRDGYARCVGINELEMARGYGLLEEAERGMCYPCVWGNRPVTA